MPSEELTTFKFKVECRRPHPTGSSPSDILGRNLENSSIYGQRLPCGSAAHHIVSWDDSRAKESRDILQKNRIGINSAENGVVLPETSQTTQIPGIPHASVHTLTYHLEVRNRLRIAEASGGRQGVLTELAKIRRELLAGTFPII